MHSRLAFIALLLWNSVPAHDLPMYPTKVVSVGTVSNLEAFVNFLVEKQIIEIQNPKMMLRARPVKHLEDDSQEEQFPKPKEQDPIRKSLLSHSPAMEKAGNKSLKARMSSMFKSSSSKKRTLQRSDGKIENLDYVAPPPEKDDSLTPLSKKPTLQRSAGQIENPEYLVSQKEADDLVLAVEPFISALAVELSEEEKKIWSRAPVTILEDVKESETPKEIVPKWRRDQEKRVEKYRWIAGQTVLIQTGNMVGGGVDTIAIFALLKRLQKQAEEAGGAVIPLLGNQDTMNICGQWYNIPTHQEVATFADPEETMWRALKNRQEAFSQTGFIGKELRTWDSVVVVAGTLYSHAGLGGDFVQQTVPEINQRIRDAMDFEHVPKSESCEDPNSVLEHEDGPQWNAVSKMLDPWDSLICKDIKQTLLDMDVERIVIGHNTRYDGSIRSNCGETLFAIDVAVEGNPVAALEMNYAYRYGKLMATGVDFKALYAGKIDKMDVPKAESRKGW